MCVCYVCVGVFVIVGVGLYRLCIRFHVRVMNFRFADAVGSMSVPFQDEKSVDIYPKTHQ